MAGVGGGVRVGVAQQHLAGLLDAVDSPRFATVVGLAQYGKNRVALGAAAPSGRRAMAGAGPGMDKLAQRVKTWLQDFF